MDNVLFFQWKDKSYSDENHEKRTEQLREKLKSQLPEGAMIVILPAEVDYVRSECFEKSVVVKPFGGTPFAPTSLK